MNKYNIIQFNCNGILGQFNDIKTLIANHDPEFILLQELKISDTSRLTFKGYILLSKFNSENPLRASVGILIKEHIPFEEVSLDENIMAIGINTILSCNVSIISFYDNQRSNQLSTNNLLNMVSKMKYPTIIMGDFNAHSNLWDRNFNQNNDPRAECIVNFLFDNSYSLMNDGSLTRISNTRGHNSSAIDLTIVDSRISHLFNWTVSDVMWGSDHLPTYLYLHSQTNNSVISRSKWNFNTTNWDDFNNNCFIDSISEIDVDEWRDKIQTEIQNGLNASTKKVKISHDNKRNVPWWNNDLETLKKDKRKTLRKFKHCPNDENMIQYKKANAVFRKSSNDNKTKSWEKYIGDINGHLSTKDIWNRVSKLNKNYRSPDISVLNDSSNNLTTNKTEIANIIGQFFEDTSNESKLPPSTRSIKQVKDNSVLNSDDNFQDANTDLTLHELCFALQNASGSSPGPDGITYQVYKNLNISNKRGFLKFLNHIWITGRRPNEWNNSFVIPIPKVKCPKFPDKVRPITLMNTDAKLLDKVVNSRLLFILENNKLLSEQQSGFRPKRTTDHYIIPLVLDAQHSIQQKSHTQAISFDLEKAFDKIWPSTILSQMSDMGIGGFLFTFTENFLKERSFKVNNGGHFSDQFTINIGVPQGSPISSTLFLIGFESILKPLTNLKNIKSIAYADDLLIYSSSDDNNTNTSILQNAIDVLTSIGSKSGLNISKEKTKSIHFCNKYKCKRKVNKLFDVTIEEVRHLKILGVWFDQKLSWSYHINNLRNRLATDLSLIRCLSHSRYGASQEVIRSIIISLPIAKIRHGICAYGFCCNTNRKKIDSTINTFKRNMLNAYCTTPIDSLSAETGILNFTGMLEKETVKLILKFKSSSYFLNNRSIFSNGVIINSSNDNTFIGLAKCLLRDSKFTLVKILEREICFEPWINSAQYIVPNIFKGTKSEANPQMWKTIFRDFIETEFFRDVIYTDGSKKENAAGYAGIYNKATIFEKAVHPYTCILDIELYGILEAVNFSIQNQLLRTIIASDSASALQCIANPRNTFNEIALKIARKLNSNLKVIWVPGHLGFTGNELADQAANSIAVELSPYKNELSFKDSMRENITFLRRKNDIKWRQTNNKLLYFKQNTSYSGFGAALPRWDRTRINRLRLGHSAYTHGFLVSKDPQPTCNICNIAISIPHIFSCPEFEMSRQKFNIHEDGSDLKNESFLRNVIDFLKEIDIYEQL